MITVTRTHARLASLVAVVAAGLFVLAACPTTPPPDPTKPPAPPKLYPDGEAGLHELWNDILVASQRDERQKVHDLMASMMMVDEDMNALFGAARAADLKPRYQPMILRLVNVGAMELIAQITDRKYDDVAVFTVDDKGTAEDRATLAALPPGTKVYGVRVKKKDETRGLRYDFFVYRNAHWVTGNQLAKHLPPVAGAAPSDGGTSANPPAPAAPAAPAVAPKRNDGGH